MADKAMTPANSSYEVTTYLHNHAVHIDAINARLDALAGHVRTLMAHHPYLDFGQPEPAVLSPDDAALIPQPDYRHVFDAYVAGAKEYRELALHQQRHGFDPPVDGLIHRSADAYCKLVLDKLREQPEPAAEPCCACHSDSFGGWRLRNGSAFCPICGRDRPSVEPAVVKESLTAEPPQADPPDWPALPPNCRRITAEDVPLDGDLICGGNTADDWIPLEIHGSSWRASLLKAGCYARPLDSEPLLTASEGEGEALASEAGPPAEDCEVTPAEKRRNTRTASYLLPDPYGEMVRDLLDTHEREVAAVRASILAEVQQAWNRCTEGKKADDLHPAEALDLLLDEFDAALDALRRK